MPQPTKEQVRDYMERRRADRRAPPDMKQIQRELSWELTEMEKRMYERRCGDRRFGNRRDTDRAPYDAMEFDAKS